MPDDGRLDWYDLTGPAPTGFGADLHPKDQFTVTVVMSVVTDIALTVNTAVFRDAINVHGNSANEASDDKVIVDLPTAVDLLYWRATALPGMVLLEWATAVEMENCGFSLVRSSSGVWADGTEIAFVPAAGTGTAGGAVYAHRDLTAGVEAVYTYWLVDVDTAGRRFVHDPIEVLTVPQADRPYRLYVPLVSR